MLKTKKNKEKKQRKNKEKQKKNTFLDLQYVIYNSFILQKFFLIYFRLNNVFRFVTMFFRFTERKGQFVFT